MPAVNNVNKILLQYYMVDVKNVNIKINSYLIAIDTLNKVNITIASVANMVTSCIQIMDG